MLHTRNTSLCCRGGVWPPQRAYVYRLVICESCVTGLDNTHGQEPTPEIRSVWELRDGGNRMSYGVPGEMRSALCIARVPLSLDIIYSGNTAQLSFLGLTGLVSDSLRTTEALPSAFMIFFRLLASEWARSLNVYRPTQLSDVTTLGMRRR